MKVAPLTAALALLISGTSVAQIDERPLRVEKIECRGNRSTSCEFIRSHLNLAAGMSLDEAEIRNAQLRLSSLRNFESVDIRLERGAQRNDVIVVLEVTEASPVATESAIGLSSRLEATQSVLAGRLAHQNVFGAGETIDIAAVAITPITGDASIENYAVHLRYADPNLFDSDKYYGIARVSWNNLSARDIHGNFVDAEGAELDVRVGRRFGDFSYLTLGLVYRPNDWVNGRWRSEDGEFGFDIDVHDDPLGWNLVYGRNSEDDLYFPTHGSSFHIAVGRNFGSDVMFDLRDLQFRKTWQLNDGLLAVKIGGPPSPEYRVSFDESQLISLNYARPLKTSETLKRGRWYIEPGFSSGSRTAQNEEIYEVGLKVGVRLDTTAFGIVDLYLMGSVDPQR